MFLVFSLVFSHTYCRFFFNALFLSLFSSSCFSPPPLMFLSPSYLAFHILFTCLESSSSSTPLALKAGHLHYREIFTDHNTAYWTSISGGGIELRGTCSQAKPALLWFMLLLLFLLLFRLLLLLMIILLLLPRMIVYCSYYSEYRNEKKVFCYYFPFFYLFSSTV